MAILVTGGAGYIGSHAVCELLKKGYEVVILDSLEKGHKEAVLGGKLYVGNLRDEEILKKVFTENKIEAVIHFAAYSLVGESVEKPEKYYENNSKKLKKISIIETDEKKKYINKVSVKLFEDNLNSEKTNMEIYFIEMSKFFKDKNFKERIKNIEISPKDIIIMGVYTKP